MKNPNIRAFVTAYVGCALWSSTASGVPEDTQDGTFDTSMESYGLNAEDIAPTERFKLMRDCIAFYREHEDLLLKRGTPEQHGHDYWLTRNRHGAGFWDRGYPTHYARKLTEAANAAGTRDLYVGDDQLIYGF